MVQSLCHGVVGFDFKALFLALSLFPFFLCRMVQTFWELLLKMRLLCCFDFLVI